MPLVDGLLWQDAMTNGLSITATATFCYKIL